VNVDPAPDHAGARERVTLPVRGPQDLVQARGTVIDAALGAGIDADRAQKLAVAVSEIATNALIHATGIADLQIITEPGGVTVEISDRGPGLPADHNSELPSATQEHGRGLWLARQLCDRVDVVSTGRGTSIALAVRRQTQSTPQ
jgi:serine/threonine-protein kinase RsbW